MKSDTAFMRGGFHFFSDEVSYLISLHKLSEEV